MGIDETETLVSAEWVAERLPAFERDDPELVLVEVDVVPDTYAEAHLPGAVGLDWRTDLQDPTIFDVPSKAAFEELLGGLGITETSTIVCYGDVDNWFAAYAYWVLTYYGHDDVRLLDGGREYWLEQALPTTDTIPSFVEQSYEVDAIDESIRVDREGVLEAMEAGTQLVDVRAPAEYRGEILSPPGWNEGVQRGGHIPGAINVPWSRVVRPDGRFKPPSEIRAVYEDAGVVDDETIVYCRIGERSALTWVALTELLGFDAVSHYYGSWVEWGNTVGAPVERGRPAEHSRND